jgi:peroxiredoxin
MKSQRHRKILPDVLALALGAALVLGLSGVRAGEDPEGGKAIEASPQARIGQAAPDFTLPDTEGVEHSLSALKDKVVVLEWFNNECPFVQKHYESGNMPNLQKKYTGEGVVWLTICSSAPGKQGYYPAEEMKKVREERKAGSTATLLDPEGDVGRLYGAKTTPHMFVIDTKGVLAYDGAIDSIRSTDRSDIDKAEPYFAQAVDEVLAAKPVTNPTTTPYGCSVKYAK